MRLSNRRLLARRLSTWRLPRPSPLGCSITAGATNSGVGGDSPTAPHHCVVRLAVAMIVGPKSPVGMLQRPSSPTSPANRQWRCGGIESTCPRCRELLHSTRLTSQRKHVVDNVFIKQVVRAVHAEVVRLDTVAVAVTWKLSLRRTDSNPYHLSQHVESDLIDRGVEMCTTKAKSDAVDVNVKAQLRAYMRQCIVGSLLGRGRGRGGGRSSRSWSPQAKPIRQYRAESPTDTRHGTPIICADDEIVQDRAH